MLSLTLRVSIYNLCTRVLTKATSAKVQLSIRTHTQFGATGSAGSIPLEPFQVNKDMGRILLRRGGETVTAGMQLYSVHEFVLMRVKVLSQKYHRSRCEGREAQIKVYKHGM